MNNSLAWFLGWRYARATTQNRFIRFISASSVVGIALGCTVLILVLSAMNGFERELKERLLSVVSHIEFTSVEPTGIGDWQQLQQMLEAKRQVEAVAPFIVFNGLVQRGNKLKPVEIRGIDWQQETHVSNLQSYITPQEAKTFQSQGGLILGSGLAKTLGFNKGDFVEILVPEINQEMKLTAPKLLRVQLIATFTLGGQLDYSAGYIPLATAANISGWDQGVQSIRLKVTDLFEAPFIARELGYNIPHYVYINDWTRTYGHLYNDIQLVRTVMYIILALVIAVACFNIVSTLVMAVNEKAADIAILKTMGASRQTIVQTFVVQGLYNGVLGTSIGVGLGVVLSQWLSDIMRAVEALSGSQFLSADVYFIDFLPTQLEWLDVVITAVVAIILALISTIYPALRASRLQPVQHLGAGK